MSDPTPKPLAVPPRIAARMLCVSEPTLRKLGIPKVRVGSSGVRYSVEDLREWLRQNREPIEPESET
ncbi:MAG: helix-turn-helix domain-containing protein [Planctomycetaceae bacterium]|nr:helix-turn-helix domain-containing protein [Planctomycetaceae bacterium]